MTEMSPAEEVFFAALERPASDRAAYLDEACAGEPGLRERVEKLLAAHSQVGGFLEPESPAPESHGEATGAFVVTPLVPQADTEPPVRLVAGRYKLLQQIGEGGMGVVWMADQTMPVKRRVAVKLIRVERGGSATVLARFEAERQAIALMDHPNIAKLLDAGTADEGVPFFVMELVKGVPLNDYCDAHRLGVPERLALFTQVCSAVQHAHQKGVVHRDLKPSNILVESHDGRPMPKVIDFGLAKAISGMHLTEKTLFTGFGTVMGTPLYMAPEQASFNAVDVDTRADVYALGVILYELLTGTTPLTRESVKRAALDEMLRLVREQEAPTPSSRLSSADALPSVAANRHTEPVKLGRFVRGELDWIVLKALSKDRERRYETANGFARDIERFLNHEPVAAGPPSAAYKLRKFVQRNRVQAIAAGLVLVALVAGMAGTTWGLIEAKEQGRVAGERTEGERLAKIEAQENEKLAVEAAGNERAARLAEERQRKYAEAIAAFARDDFLALTSVEGQDRFGGEGLDRNATLLDLLNRAAAKLRKRTDLDPAVEAELCWIVGVNYRGAGEAAKGVPFLERAVELRRRILGADHPDTLNARNSLAVAYRVVGRLDEALALLKETLERKKAVLGPDHSDTLVGSNNLAEVYRDVGKLGEARSLFEETVARMTAVLGPDHPFTLAVSNNLAESYRAAGRLDEALALYERTLALRKARLGPDHPDTLNSTNDLAVIYESIGRLEEALPLWKDALARMEARLGPDHPFTLTGMANLASGYRAAGKLEEAIPAFERTLARMRAKLGPDHTQTVGIMHDLAAAYWSRKRLDESVPLFEEALGIRERKLGRQHPDTQAIVANLGVNYKDAGRLKEAIPLLDEAYRASGKYPSLRWVSMPLADARRQAGETARPTELLLDRLADARQTLPGDSPILTARLAQAGTSLLEMKEFARAEPLLRECLAIREKTLPDTWAVSNAQSLLGASLLGQKKYAEAEPLLLKGYEGMKTREKTIPPQGSTRIPEAIDRLVELYSTTGKPDEAAKWKVEAARYPEPAPVPRLKK